jgi:predicted AlkP superfamily pyrophosphatase or phosphodiesterase
MAHFNNNSDRKDVVNRLCKAALGLVLGLAVTVPAIAQGATSIKLVLQITVDGLRGDQLERFSGGFGDNGFRYLLDKGTVYTNAHYQHANTETIVGHTTLATGASPSEHGMIGNAWFDRKAGALGYNLEDPDYPLLTTRDNQAKGKQVDPAQRASRSDGRSPRPILVPTLSDTLAAYYTGRAKIFSVSGKDRGAIPMAGHSGKAFWFSTDTGDFVTSKYYYDEYPGWVKTWNEARHAHSHADAAWELSSEISRYLLIEHDDRPYEADLKGYGRTFPHPFGHPDDKLFYTRLLVSSVGDELTADFAKKLLVSEGLGIDSIPDYLSISFSGVDAVNHFFGPSSLEQEAVIRGLDQTLADLLSFVDEKVGLRHTLIVLSADHGMADMPEYMAELGLETGRLSPNAIVEAANAAGASRFGVEGLVQAFYRPYVYLDLDKLVDKGLKRKAVEDVIADALRRVEGVALAIPVSGLAAAERTPILDRIRRNHHPARSGDIYVVQDPYWFLFADGPVVAMHGSPYRYDTHVPIIFAGGKLPAQRLHHRVRPVDVAPTIAALLGIGSPASTQGTVLQDVFTASN